MASVAANRGALPAITDVREAPTSLTARVKKICETPGASSPARAKTASSFELTGSPPPRSNAIATTATSAATTVLATAPTSGSGCRFSAARRETVIAPNDIADARARRIASTSAASEAWRSTPEG